MPFSVWQKDNTNYNLSTLVLWFWLHLAQSESKSNQASDTSGQRNNSRLTRPYVSKTPAKEVAVIVVSVVTKTNVAHIALQTIWPWFLPRLNELAARVCVEER